IETRPFCQEQDKTCFLINATIQDNDDEILAGLRKFSHIWVRESATKRALEESAIEATLCGDLSLYNNYPIPRVTENRPLVLDSVRSRANRQLERLALRVGGEFASMKRTEAGAMAYPRR